MASDFATMAAKERERLQALLQDIATRRKALDEEASAAKRELAWFEGYEAAKTGKKHTSTGTRAPRGSRSTGLVDIIKEKPMNRAQLLEHMGAKGDKKQEQSISNALANLKKAGKLKHGDDGIYRAA